MGTERVENGKVVSLHYTLTDDGGRVLDTSSGGAPLDYLHGAGNIIPGLEREVEGRSPGERFPVRVPASEAYGERRGAGPQAVPREAFPTDLELEPGMQFLAQDGEGNDVHLWVTRVEAHQVYVDQDHPLAGLDLNFEVEVVAVRDATLEERAHGHPHPDGGTTH